MKSSAPKIKRWVLIAGALLLVFIILQFLLPAVQNPPVSHPIQAPADVVKVLQKGCYDCHSNETKLRWYDKIAPVSWAVSSDVEVARSRFNFSTWDTLHASEQQGRIWEMVNMVLTGKMPLPSYAFVHPGSRLSQDDIGVLTKYAIALSPSHYHDSSVVGEADREFENFRRYPFPTTREIATVNGIRYIPDYQEWQVISRTNRFDNHSIRVVYGNAVMVKAIRENHINPFPDGSTIVKVVWNSIEEIDGEIRPGSLNSVQVMTKDDNRFPDSQGWGFAKFNGINLKPYGETPLFNATCFNCHKITSATGYVFNVPLEDTSAGAGVRPMFNAEGLHVIASFANRRLGRMSVLYGNEAAKKYALSGYTTPVPGAIFTLLVNRQADNKFWYGSYINGAVESVESVSAPASSDKDGLFAYTLDKGTAPTDSLGRPMSAGERIRYILSHRPSVFP